MSAEERTLKAIRVTRCVLEGGGGKTSKLAKERLIRRARVVVALRRLDLALILWAVGGSSRTHVLEALLAGELTGPQIIQRTGVPDCSAYRVLEELMGAGLIVSVGEIEGRIGPRARVYKLASGEGRRVVEAEVVPQEEGGRLRE
jgi:DNA-binding transcriptional ArsR family regulator